MHFLICNRRDCEVMAGELSKANIAALAYHAGLKDEERSMVQQRWVLEDRCKVHNVHVPVFFFFFMCTCIIMLSALVMSIFTTKYNYST